MYIFACHPRREDLHFHHTPPTLTSNSSILSSRNFIMATDAEKYTGASDEKYGEPHARTSSGDNVEGEVLDNVDFLHRRLGNRQIQLIAIGGSIGTALFVSIGGALNKGGPLGMLLAYAGYSCVIALVNNSMAEMATYMPVSGGFIRMAGKWVDEAFGKPHPVLPTRATH